MIGDLIAINKLRSKSIITKSGCVEWTGLKDKDGYGMLYRLGFTRAHRISYLVHKGPIPEGGLICHHCDNPSCVNPEHLFLGTPKDNTVDCSRKGRLHMQNVKITHCKRGHEFTEENSYGIRGSRKCKKCTLDFYYKNKERYNKSRVIRKRLQRAIAKQQGDNI